MKVHFGTDNIPPISYAVVTSGTFDGVHLGHQKIIRQLNELSHKHSGESVVLTFWPHPRMVLHPNDHNIKLLSTLEEKIILLEKYGINHLVILPFTKEFSLLSSENFIQDILIDKIQTKELVIGFDHRFGKNREGSYQYLIQHQDKYPFKITEIAKHDVENIDISSTKIRSALSEGDIQLATKLLGHTYSLSGKVVLGDQLGRKIGFPTANLQSLEEHKLIPVDGVYAVQIKLAQHTYNGMLNIGFRPTVSGIKRTIEVNIFDFNSDIYGEEISIYFVKLIRKEKKFQDIHALKDQLIEDKHIAQTILTSH